PKKRGFVPVARVEYATITLSRLNDLKGTTITNQALVDQGVAKNTRTAYKVLGSGSISTKKTVQLQAATKSAQAAIVKAGGTFAVTPLDKTSKKPAARNRKE